MMLRHTRRESKDYELPEKFRKIEYFKNLKAHSFMSLKVLVEIINDIEEFIERLEKKKQALEELKDELLIYSDEEFMKSVERGLEDLKEGRFKRCTDLNEVKNLFESL